MNHVGFQAVRSDPTWRMCPGPKEQPLLGKHKVTGPVAQAASGYGVDLGSKEFVWSYGDEPHKSRRDEMLLKYPQIKKLYGPCKSTKWKVATIMSIQFLGAIVLRNAPWPLLLALTYTLSGCCNHYLTLAMHELAHNLGFKGATTNKIFSIITNLPLGIPAAISFKRYHMEHHKYQGEDVVDVDIPTEAEGRIFRGVFMKVLFLFLTPAFYSLRPLFVRPKKPTAWEGINFATQLTFDFLVFYFLGTKSLFYLVIGTLLGMGVHPMAGHFVAEHYVYQKDQETYSYYGPLNWLSVNVGYHNEHHDFPYVPGSRLHTVRQIAPEFYMDRPHYYSWVKVLWDFVVDPAITPFSRIKRRTISEQGLKDLTQRAD